MARQQETAPRAQRLVAIGAIALLATATALAFGRVFRGHEATWKLVGAALASTAVAAVFERRSLLLATFASFALMLVAVGLLVFPETTLGGLPTKETLRAIGRAMGQVGAEARVQVSPTPPIDPLLLAAVTAVWTATFSSFALAIRAGSPVLATLPPVALVGFADTVLQDGVRPGYALAFLLSVLAVVFVDGLRRIRQWGPVWQWSGAGRRRLTSTTGKGARRVAIVALGFATLAPGILPGFHDGPLIDLSTGGSDLINIDPFVSVHSWLREKTPVTLFTVTASAPSYWRLLSLDNFDGASWTSADPDASKGQLLHPPAAIPSLDPVGNEPLIQSYRVEADIGSPFWLPMAFPPQFVDVGSDTLAFDPTMTAVVAPDGLHEGDNYTVTSLPLTPTGDQLRSASFDVPTHYADTFLPGDMPTKIKDIATAWTAGATTNFDRVLAIQDHLNDPSQFRYDTSVRPVADSTTLLRFLTTDRAGFCQQFATAMAALVRELNIPARVAVGFSTGAQVGPTAADGTRTYRVTTANAHTWVEVYFPGYGWLPFEPTPQRTNPIADIPGSYLSTIPPGGCPPAQGQCGGGTKTHPGTQGRPGWQNRRASAERHTLGHALPVGPPVSPASRFPWELVAWAVLVLAGATLLLVPSIKAVSRRVVLARAREPRELVLTTFRVFNSEAADIGLGRATGETLQEYRRRLLTSVPFSNGHLERLTDAAARAAYSSRPIDESEAHDAAADARTAIRSMRRDAGLLKRITGIYRPKL